MSITMDGKYAYRESPRKQVRILCIDRPWVRRVIAMGGTGTITAHLSDGKTECAGESPLDLIPLDVSLVVTTGLYRTRDGTLATICYIRSDLKESKGFLAVGWFDARETGADSWKLNGKFGFGVDTHRLDLVERIGDLP